MDDWPIARFKCYYCGDIASLGIGKTMVEGISSRLKEADNKVIDMNPCSKCEGYMKQGIILLTIDNEKSTPGWNIPPIDPDERKHWIPNPYRTGGFFVVKEEYIQKIFDKTNTDLAMRLRFSFIEHEAAEMLGFFEHAKTDE